MQKGEVFFTERCPSGIPGFDSITNGGFIRNSVNAVLGGPGAGKTIFLLQFLYKGATEYGENGLYISFENDVVDIFKDSLAMGWDFAKLDARDQCKFMRFSPLTSVPIMKKELTAIVAKYGIKRVCLDPIGLFGAGEENDSKLRIMIFEITSMLKRMNVTVLLANETAAVDAEELTSITDVRSQYVKFLVDGLVDIFSSGLGGVSDRAVRVVKMRRTNHSRGPIPMEISSEGIKIIAKQKGKSF